MQITVEIPEAYATQIIASGKQPSQAALEALALEGYRARQLSEYQIQQMLGLETRLQVHAFLKDHQTHLNYSIEDFDQDMETIRRVRAAQGTQSLPSQAG